MKLFLVLCAISVFISAYRIIDIIILKEGSKFYKESRRDSFLPIAADSLIQLPVLVMLYFVLVK